VRVVHVVLAHADPPAMALFQEDYRAHKLTSTEARVERRLVLGYLEARQLQAQRTVGKLLPLAD
jgi:hypothetical protein